MTTPEQSPSRDDAVAAIADAHGNVATSLTCRTCGYELRGLPAEGNCPECGLAVRRSVRTDLLEDSDPQWLRRLMLGCRIFNVGFIGSLAVFIGSLLFGLLIGILAAQTGGVAGASWVGNLHVAVTMVSGVTALIMLVGAWMLTEPDPGRHEEESLLSARRRARYGLLLGVLVSPWGMFVGGWTGATAIRITTSIVLGSVGVVISIVAIIAWHAYFIFIGRLVARAPARKITVQTRVLAWGYAASMGLTSLSGVLALTVLPGLGSPNQSPGQMVMMMIVGLGSCAGSVFYLGFMIWALIVQLLIARELTRIARQTSPTGT